MGRHLRGRSEPLGMPGSFEPGLDDSLQRVWAFAALAAAVIGFVLPAGAGWWLAVLALVFGFPALALYNTTLAVFCGGDCWIAVGPGFTQRLIVSLREQARSHRDLCRTQILYSLRNPVGASLLAMRPVAAQRISLCEPANCATTLQPSTHSPAPNPRPADSPTLHDKDCGAMPAPMMKVSRAISRRGTLTGRHR